MSTLDWIGKKAVLNHHRQVPYRLLHCNGRLSAEDPDAGNPSVQGDNLPALKAFLPDYAGKIKRIYIDPPFNSNRNYEVFWGETKEKRAFQDRHANTQAYIEYRRPRCVGLACNDHCPLGAQTAGQQEHGSIPACCWARNHGQ